MRQPVRAGPAWLKLAKNQIYCLPENQAKTMDEPEHNVAPKVLNGRINGQYLAGVSGNPGGSPEATRRAFNKRFLLDLAEDWQQHGREVFKRVRRESPAAYLKVCAMLVPKEVKLEHSIEVIQAMLAAQAGEAVKVIEGTAGPAALPAPEASIGAGLEPKRQRRPNRLMMQADTAVGPRERIPRKVLPASTLRSQCWPTTRGGSSRQDLVACWIVRYAGR